jgi:hypothetical protein
MNDEQQPAGPEPEPVREPEVEPSEPWARDDPGAGAGPLEEEQAADVEEQPVTEGAAESEGGEA